MRKVIFRAVVMILAIIITWCRPALGESPEVVMRVALSVAVPFEFVLEQDAKVFPLLPAGSQDDEKEACSGRESEGGKPYISLSSSKEPFLIKAGNVPREVVLCYPSGGAVSFLGGLRIVPVDHGASAFQIGDRHYPGVLEISCGVSRTGSYEIIAVNLVDLESYTEGVLAGEVYPSWAPEALKAQAVAARTYALRRKTESESRNRVYDVDDTVLSQVYLGKNRVEAFRDAVSETRGEVLVYEGIPIKAHYFASGGGTTEGDEEVWLGGSNEPYLTAREDFDRMSPHYRWKEPFVIKGSDLLGKLGLKSADAGWIEPSIRSGDKILAYRFNAGGRTVNLTREQIRQKLGLQSPRFDIAIRDGEGMEKTLKSRESLSSSTVLIFDGVGKGHGVGLSQWGAQGMATMLARDGAPLYTYVDILSHYYPGAELVDNYNIPKGLIELEGLIELALDKHVESVYEGNVEPAQEDHAEQIYEDDKDHREAVCEDHTEPVEGDHTKPEYEEHTEEPVCDGETELMQEDDIEPVYDYRIQVVPE